MSKNPIFAALVAALPFACSLAARADVLPPISVSAGVQLPTQGSARTIAGSTQTDFGLAYDFGPAIVLPIRAFLAADYAAGSRSGGRLDDYGVGIGVRLTTPLYAGASVSYYSLSNTLPGSNGSSATTTWQGSGSDLFVGERLFGLPGGVNVNLEANYKILPSYQGVNPDAFGVDLRLHL
jgi:hypothetical protein